MKKIIYADNASSCQIDERVINTMNDVLINNNGNPHSNSHKIGWNAAHLLSDSRNKIAKFINAKEDEIIFTSGATESNNLALFGIARFYKEKGNHIITMVTEHACVLNSCEALEKEGFEITYLEPDINGLLDLDLLKKAIKPTTILISIMFVNNETGVIQEIKEIGKIASDNNIFFHTDSAQAFGKIKINVEEMNIDSMSISGHKIYGPKGIGALYVRKNKKRVKLKPIIYGGGQERGMRSGTVPTFLAASIAKAVEIAEMEMDKNYNHLMKLRQIFLEEMLKLEDIFVNGDIKNSFPGIINISILHIEGEGLMLAIPEICVSTGSACNSKSLEPSYVIRSMYKNLPDCDYRAHSSIRFSFSKFTTEEEVLYIAETLTQAVNKLRSKSPLWEMKKNGIDIHKIKWSSHH